MKYVDAYLHDVVMRETMVLIIYLLDSNPQGVKAVRVVLELDHPTRSIKVKVKWSCIRMCPNG